MRREIPDCVHVGPDRPETRALRVEVVNLAHFAGGQVLLDRSDARVVEERVTHHEGPSVSLGEVDQLACVLARRCEGFLDKHVLARLERHSRQTPMGGSVGHDRHRVGLGPGHRLRGIVCDANRKSSTDLIKTIHLAVADDNDAGIAELAEDANVVCSPVPSSNDGDSRRSRADVDHGILRLPHGRTPIRRLA